MRLKTKGIGQNNKELMPSKKKLTKWKNISKTCRMKQNFTIIRRQKKYQMYLKDHHLRA